MYWIGRRGGPEVLHEDREKRRWETFRKSGEWRETTPCVKLTIALFSQSRVRVFNNATIHSCAHTLFSILAVSRHRRRSPLPLLSIDVSFFAFARLRSSQSFQSFPLERRATLSYPFTPPLPRDISIYQQQVVYPRRMSSEPPTVGTMRNAFLWLKFSRHRLCFEVCVRVYVFVWAWVEDSRSIKMSRPSTMLLWKSSVASERFKDNFYKRCYFTSHGFMRNWILLTGQTTHC